MTALPHNSCLWCCTGQYVSPSNAISFYPACHAGWSTVVVIVFLLLESSSNFCFFFWSILLSDDSTIMVCLILSTTSRITAPPSNIIMMVTVRTISQTFHVSASDHIPIIREIERQQEAAENTRVENYRKVIEEAFAQDKKRLHTSSTNFLQDLGRKAWIIVKNSTTDFWRRSLTDKRPMLPPAWFERPECV